MQLKNLKINNFQSIAEVEFGFPSGLVLIDGWNEDLGSHNGVGKSALLNAITFAIYGQTPKDIKLEEFLRDGTPNMSVSIELESKGVNIQITRSRTKSAGKIELTLNGEKVDGLSKDIEERIPALVGLSFEQFVQVVYIFQGASQRFVTLNDTEKKKFLSTILNLDVYDNAYRLAHTKLSSLELELSKLTGNRESTERNIAMYLQALDGAKKDAEIFEAEKETRLAGLSNEAKQINSELKELELQKMQVAKSTLLDQLTMAKGDVERKLGVFVKVRSEITTSKYQASSVDKEIIRLVASLEKQVDKCGECGQELPGWDRESHRKGIAETITTRQEERSKIIKKFVELEALLAEEPAVQEQKNSIIGQMAEEKAKGPDRFDPMINLKKSELKRVSQEVQGLSERSDSFKKGIQKAFSSVEAARGDLEAIKAGMVGLEDKKKYLLELKKIFSPTGIRAYVFDGIIKDINNRIDTYLSTLSNGSMKFEFVSEDSKGKFAEICVHNGMERSIDALSGGEFRRLSLAVDLALADTVCSRISVYPNVLFVDEGFEGLDVSGRETVMTLLSDLIQRKDAIYIVDHASEFKTAFGKVFKLVKKNGETRVE